MLLLLSGCMFGSFKMESLKNDGPSAAPGVGTQSQIQINRQDGQALSAGGLVLPVGTSLSLKALLYSASGELSGEVPVYWFLKPLSGQLNSGLSCAGTAQAECQLIPSQIGTVIVEAIYAGSDSSLSDLTANTPAIQVVALTTASSLEISGGNLQTVVADSNSPVPLKIKAKDSFGQPVAGVSVSFSVIAGGGSITSALEVTDASGEASTTLKAGTLVGALNNVVVAQVVTNPSLTQSFYASTAPSAAHHLSYLTQPAGSYTLLPLSQQPVVQLRDQFENLVPSSSNVVLSRQTGTGALGGLLTVPMINGTASFTNVTYSVAEPGIVLRATSGTKTVDSVPFVVTTSGGSVDRNPLPPNFLLKISTLPGASGRTTSSSWTLSSIDVPIDIFVSGAGNPKLKLNGGAEVSSLSSVNIFAQIELVADAPTISGTKNTITVTAGGTIATWQLGYADTTRVAPIFVTEADYNGNFGGLAGADAICQSSATAAGLGGSWVAMVTGQTTNMRDRLPWNFGQVRRLDGAVVANSFDDLWDGTWDSPVNLTENLTVKNAWVWWGGTVSGGATFSSGTTCNEFTNGSTGTLFTSSNNSSGSAVALVSRACVNSQAFYCLGDTSGAVDIDPNDVEFLSQVSYVAGARMSSNTVSLAGITSSISVSVSGSSGNPRLKIDGGSEVTSGTASFGDTIQLVMDAPSTLGTKNTLTVTMGSDIRTWWVGYGDNTKSIYAFISDSALPGPTGTSDIDSRCQNFATAAGLAGNWKALIADSAQGGGPRNRMSFNWGALKRIDGTVLATSWDDLWDGTISAPLNLDSNGIARNVAVRTGSMAAGQVNPGPSLGTCGDWTNYIGSTTFGVSTGTGNAWLQNQSVLCWNSVPTHNYCYQEAAVDDLLPLPFTFPMSVSYVGGAPGRTTSLARTLTGINTTISVSVTGSPGSNPMLKINGGAETASGTAQNGDSIQVVMDAPVVTGTKFTATASLGLGTHTWNLAYADSARVAKVFTADASVSGNLAIYGGGNQLCQDAALGAGFSGTWKALIGHVGIPLRDTTPYNWGTLKRVDGAIVANNWEDFWDGTLQNPINKTQNGTAAAPYVWTGAPDNIGESQPTATCSDWTLNSPYISTTIGTTSSATAWLYNLALNCAGSSHSYDKSIYCIEDVISDDLTPNTMTFPYKLYQNVSSRISSDAIAVTGITAPAPVTLIGSEGSPAFKINGGAEVTSGSVVSGDTITLVMTSAGGLNQSHKMEVQIGNGSPVPWRIWTGDSASGIKKRIFVTSTSHTGNLGGLAGADAICQARAASNPGLTAATWKALLSSGTNLESGWAINRMGYDWSELWTVNTDGTPRAKAMGALQVWDPNINLLVPINYTEVGVISSASYVRTGTNSLGLATLENCQGWTAYGDSSKAGSGVPFGMTSTWISAFNIGCNSIQPIYCVEQ